MNGLTGKVPRGCAVVAAWLLTACSCTPLGIAWALELESVHIDHVAVMENGKHRIWISALDGEGHPLDGLPASAFSVTEDGESMYDVSVEPFDTRYRGVDVAVILDPLVASEIGEPGSEWAERLLAELRPGDRLRLVGTGDGLPTVTVRSRAELESARERLRSLGAPSPPRVFDALFREIKHASHSGRGHVILLVTQAVDRRSNHEALEALVLLRSFTRPAPISVIQWEDAAEADDASRLNRIAQESGGTYRRVGSVDALASALSEAAGRARGAYLLSYSAKHWDGQADQHHLRVGVRQAGAERIGEITFASDDAVVPARPWGVWIAALLLVVLSTLTAAFVFRPRSIARLVIENGAERGCRFEIFETPVTIGAAEGNDILLPEPHVSRNHALLDRRGRLLELIDSNSENGTFVNRDRIPPSVRRLLSPGDTITLGGTISLTYHGPSSMRRRK